MLLLIITLPQNLSLLMTKPTKWHVHPAKTQISPVWSESSQSAWRKLGSLATQWVHNEDSDQTGWMPRLIWVFAGHTVILLVLSWGSSFYNLVSKIAIFLTISQVGITMSNESSDPHHENSGVGPSSTFRFSRGQSPRFIKNSISGKRTYGKTDKVGIWWRFADNFPYFSIKTYVVGSH